MQQLSIFLVPLLLIPLALSLSTCTLSHPRECLMTSSPLTTKVMPSLMRKTGDIAKVIFVLGGPGAGKGTQCELLTKEFGLEHLSAGELLRKERESGSADGKLIDEYIKEGKIVPVRISLALLKRSILESKRDWFLVDGFPRNWDNLQGWEESMEGVATVKRVLMVDCNEEVLQQRLLERGKVSGRTDDNIESAKKRFRTFYETTLPIIEHYERKHLVSHVPGHFPVDEVYKFSRQTVIELYKQEIISVTQRLLDAISASDFETYQELCASDMTAFESESKYQLVEGLDFHKYYFDRISPGQVQSQSTITGPYVHICGTTAVMGYNRVMQMMVDGKIVSRAFAETRVWNRDEGTWKNIHFHRSAIE